MMIFFSLVKFVDKCYLIGKYIFFFQKKLFYNMIFSLVSNLIYTYIKPLLFIS